MAPERHTLSAKERLQLASTINKICGIQPEDGIAPDDLVIMAHEIVTTLDSIVKPTNSYLRYSHWGKPRSFSGLGSSDQGQLSVNAQDEAEKKEIHLGKEPNERIGLYKVSKQDGGRNSVLTFSYYTEQRAKEADFMHIGSMTSIIYMNKDHSVEAVIRSEPALFRLGSIALIYYRSTPLWGKGSLPFTNFSFFL